MGFERQAGGIAEGGETGAVGEGRGGAAAEDHGAEGEVDFVDEAGLKEGVVDFAAAFAEEAFDVPLFAEPAEGEGEIQIAFAADFDFVGEGAELLELGGTGAVGGEDDDGGEAVIENLGFRIEGPCPADDDAEIVFGEAAAQSFLPIFESAGAEFDGGQVHGAGAGHDGVGGGAEFEEVFLVAGAAEGDEMAVGGGEFAVGGGGDVQENEGQWFGFASGFHARPSRVLGLVSWLLALTPALSPEERVNANRSSENSSGLVAVSVVCPFIPGFIGIEGTKLVGCSPSPLPSPPRRG